MSASVSSRPGPCASFTPPPGLRNPYLQTILASRPSRRQIWRARGSCLDTLARLHLLDGGDGVRLAAWYSPATTGKQSRGLAVLIHGWEGSHDSAYLHSMACALHTAGYSVLRLNLRDHGGSCHLNEDLFHSARLTEVLHAITAARRLDAQGPLFVIGFSLGGNFALRVGIHGPAAGIVPRLSVGICPSIDPASAMAAIDAGPALFRHYFLAHWRASLAAKAAAWPQRKDFTALRPVRSIVESTRRFVAAHTEYASYEDYVAAYTVTVPQLHRAASPVAILTSQDDPIIPFADFIGLAARGSVMAFDAPALGGHCGFVENWQLDSWAERRVLQLLDACT